MLSSYTFLKTRIQRLLDGLIFVKKGLGLHVQRMLKMSRGLYTGGNFKQNTRDVFYVRREVNLMKTAKVNAYIMHIFGKIELLSIHAT